MSCARKMERFRKQNSIADLARQIGSSFSKTDGIAVFCQFKVCSG